MSDNRRRRIRTHAPKIHRPKGKKESTYHRVKRHHKERAEKQAKMRGETKKQEFDSIAHLHDCLGNKKVAELHRSGKLMAMLKVSKPGDRFEKEADWIANRVMNTNPGMIHENSTAKVAPKLDLSKVSKKQGTTTETQIKNLSGGEKLDGGTKKFFKSRFDGLDLSNVNIHKSRKANKMANSINARAFTYGNNIVFNKDEYKPNTFQGKKLLAHELAHVAQQNKFRQPAKVKMDAPGRKKVNALNITNKDRTQALKSFEKRNKYTKPAPPKIQKKHSISQIDKPAVAKVEKPSIIKEETVSKTVAKSSSPSVKSETIKANQSYSVAPPVKVSSTQNKVVMGWWGKKKDEDKNKEEEEEDGKKPKGIGGFAWWAFKNLLGLIGIDVDQIMGILGKAGDALGAIVKDPKGFFGNLGKAVKGGINSFVGNFKKHLLNGIAGWLFGQLGDSGLEMPSAFNFKGILSIILQVIGLTYNNIRGQIVKGLGKGGEEMMSHAEGMFDHLKTAITEGPMALWEQLKEHLSGLKDQFFGMIIDWVKSTVIKQGVMFLISMLNPAGAVVQAVRAIIKVVTFFMERWQQIQDFASSVVDSVSLIAKGDTTAAQNGVEKSLAKAMPLTISFIAKLVGLGGISKHIKKVIKKIQKPINSAVKKVTKKFAKKIKSLPIFKKGKKALKKGRKRVDEMREKATEIKDKAEKTIDDKSDRMRKNIEDSRAEKQKNKEDEVKEKSRKGKDEHEKKEQLTEKDRKKHKVYASEIVQKLQADKGNNSKTFKEFHASKVKLAKDLEGRYQKKLKRGINIAITIPPLERDKKDDDVDFDVKIAPNNATASGSSKYKGAKTLKAWLLKNSKLGNFNKVEVQNRSEGDSSYVGFDGKDLEQSKEGIIVGSGNNESKVVQILKKSAEVRSEIYGKLEPEPVSSRRTILASQKEGVTKDYEARYIDDKEMPEEYKKLGDKGMSEEELKRNKAADKSDTADLVEGRKGASEAGKDIKGHKDKVKDKGKELEKGTDINIEKSRTELLKDAGNIKQAISQYMAKAKEEMDIAGISKDVLKGFSQAVEKELGSLEKLKNSKVASEKKRQSLLKITSNLRKVSNQVCDITKRYSEKIAEKVTKRRFEQAGFSEMYPHGEGDKQGAGDVDKIFIKKQGDKYIVVEVKGGGSQLGARDIKHNEALEKEKVRAQQGNRDYLIDTATNMQKSAESKFEEAESKLKSNEISESEREKYNKVLKEQLAKRKVAVDLLRKISSNEVDYLHAVQKIKENGELGEFSLKQFDIRK